MYDAYGGAGMMNACKRVRVSELLREANFEMTYSKLATALVTCYRKHSVGELNVIRKNEDILTLYCSMNEKVKLHRALAKKVFLDESRFHEDEQSVLWDYQLFHEENMHHLIFPLTIEKRVFSYIVFSFRLEQDCLRAMREYKEWMADIVKMLQKGYIFEVSVFENKRKELLLQVTKKFYSTMSISMLLEEVVRSIEMAFPSYKVNIYLSQEWKVSESLRTKPLKFRRNDSSSYAEKAYLTGDIQVERNNVNERLFIYAPLRGKQGVYGLMEIETDQDAHVPIFDLDFIRFLSDTGGNALESVDLYRQSRELINDLQLINETSHQLNKSLRKADTINYLTKQILHSFDADEVGFIMRQHHDELIVVEGSTSFFTSLDSAVEFRDIIEYIQDRHESVYVGDLEQHRHVVARANRSLLLVPMVQNNKVEGYVIVLHHKPYHFTFEEYKLLQSLVHHSTLAFMNSMLHEELESLVKTDYLTKLYTRNYLDESIQCSLKVDERGTLLLIDIDNFKGINDTYGHQVGDEILIQIATIMKGNVREDDIAARWGGEELAIYLPNVKASRGKKIAERIVEAVANETNPKVTVSIGLAEWNRNDTLLSREQLFQLADDGLYEAKKKGKNRVVTRKQANNNMSSCRE